MMHHAKKAGKMYEFLGERMGAVLNADDVGRVKERLEAQLGRIEEIVGNLY